MRVLCWIFLSLILASSAQAAPIHDAAKSGDVSALEAAIAGGADVNAREGNLTALYLAVQGGHIEAVRLLLKGGADPDHVAGFGYPLLAAIVAGRADIIEVLLLEGGANPNMERQSTTALHKAVESGCFDCVVLLVNAGANVNARTSERTPVIHLAKRTGNQKVVDYLMAHGVNLTVPAPISPLLTKADAAHGKTVFEQTCAGCHQIDPQFPSRAGPLLWGVVGRKHAAVDQFKYSEVMRELGGTWGYEDIGAFIADPMGVHPGTTMTFPGIDSDQDRADVVIYLRSLSDSPAPMP